MREFKPVFRHWRIPVGLTLNESKGRPSAGILTIYSRGTGFLTRSKQNPHRRVLHLGVLPQARGGMTRCLFMDNAGTIVASGTALCSLSDNFNYHVGRAIALERATHKFKQWIKIRELKEEILVHGHC